MELTGYSEIGAVLRAAREDRHISLAEAARVIHVRARYLDALERGDFSDLPGIPYAKGYIQAYAAFLELDKDEIMRRFERVDGQLAKRNFYLPKAFHSEKKPHQGAIWGSLAAVLVLFSLWHTVSSQQEKPVSIVEHFVPRLSPELSIYARQASNPACFKRQEALYPPCYLRTLPELAQDVAFRLVPLQGHPDTVLALWDNDMAQATKAMMKKQTAVKPKTKPEIPDDNDITIQSSDLPEG